MKYRRILIAAMGAILLLYIVSLVAERYLERNYTGKVIPITDQVAIVIGEIDVELMRRRLHLSDIETSDSLSFAAIGQLGSIDISGIQWLELIRKRKVKIKDVSLNDLVAAVDLSQIDPDTSSAAAPAQVVTISLPRLDLEFDADMNPRITGIEGRNISFYPESGMYNFEIRAIRADDPGEVIIIDSLIMKPRYPKLEFGYKNGFRAGSIDMVVPEVHLHKLDLQRLTRDSAIDIRNIELIAPTVKIFTDKRLPIDMTRYVAMPNEALRNAEIKIDVDSLNVKSLYLKYQTNNPKTLKEGFVEFEHSYISVEHITNIPDSIEKNPIMTLDLFSKFMGKADLNVHFQFYLNRGDYYFSWYGDLEQMDLSVANTFTKPALNIEIISGRSHSLEFSVQADIDSALGTMDFQYADLKIMAIDPETHRHRRFLSGVANLFFVNEYNMKFQPDFRQGKIRYAHETNRGLEHYLWTSLEKGFMTTILSDSAAGQLDKGSKKSTDPEESKRKKKRKKRKKK